jgi:putative phage-type endonuclease
MEIIRGVEQGSADWLSLRAGRVTASNFGKVLAGGAGKTRRAYMLQLLAERLTGAPVETYTNAAMEWGTETEPRARAVYELLTGREVEEVTMIVRDEYVSASPDGLLPGGGLEIKCPKTETHLENFLSQQMPSTYTPQVQGCIWLAEVDSWDFMSFDPRLPDASQAMIVTVSRDQDYIDKLESEVDRFVSEMLDLEARLRGDVEAVEGAA